MEIILFVCVKNSCRSQMAEGFAAALGLGLVQAYSAGSAPAEKIDPLAIEVMREAGVDISSARPKRFDQLPLREFDYVIFLGCQEVCPFVSAINHIRWDIEDPEGKEIAVFIRVRDRIKRETEKLIKQICRKKGG